MDKSWMNKPRNSNEYREGVETFLHFALCNGSYGGKIMCPCIHCANCSLQTIEDCRVHLVCDGFLKGYTQWVCHGEDCLPISTNIGPSFVHASSTHGLSVNQESNRDQINNRRHDDIEGMLCDIMGVNVPRCVNEQSSEFLDSQNNEGTDLQHEEVDLNQSSDEFSKESSTLNFLKGITEPLFPGCKKYSKLSFMLRLFHIRCLNNWSWKSVGMLLELLCEGFFDDLAISFPKTSYEMKKIIKALGLDYEKIHACKNDCMLFRGENANKDACAICGTSRWVINNDENQIGVKRKKKAAKVLRYFPLIPRLQRLFMSSRTSNDMRWHKEGRKEDGKLRHPADGEAWKAFDARYPDFAADSRNVRLALCSDGFNPFRTMSTTYSTWPVVLIPYNLPPWVCMKQSSFMLSMIIPGEKSPGNDIDIYLQPLIDELIQLWKGVEALDGVSNQVFVLRAALTWTINDFPAYANLSGYSTKGKFACPCCAENTSAKWLSHGRKHCYMGARQWLPNDHAFRYQKDFFDGTEELRPAPKQDNGSDVLKKLGSLEFSVGKASKKRKKISKRKRQNENDQSQENVEDIKKSPLNWWKKRSIFFNLPYWEHNMLRHCLDVMHIEKNVCDNLVGTLLNHETKTKDNLKARLDLVDLGIRSELHPQVLGDGRMKLPPACFTMSKQERKTFCEVLKQVKVPDGFSSNFSRCVKENKISGLKSHDCHILIQELLPVVLLSCSPSKQVMLIVLELSAFFKTLCSKVLDVNELEKIQQRIVLALCHMERIFLPSFFTIMIHLMVHLVDEAKLGGPVQYRWMYPPERYFVRLKSYVNNRAQPEGSIAEGYIVDECLTICSRYFEGIETRFNRPMRNPNPPTSDGRIKYLFSSLGEPIGKIEDIVLDEKTLEQAHRYVLRHCDEIAEFRQQFIDEEKRKRRRHTRLNQHDIDKLVNEKFHHWFRNKVLKMDDPHISTEIETLGGGPNKVHTMSQTTIGARGTSSMAPQQEENTELSQDQNQSANSPVVQSGEESNEHQIEGYLEERIDNHGKRFRKRGKTTMAEVWKIESTERIFIEINKEGVPCTKEGATLGSFIGVLARNGGYAPLHIPKWSHKDFRPFKAKTLRLLESKFVYPPETRDWILKSLNKKWRDYKSDLKAEHYHSNPRAKDEIIEARPNDVLECQWPALVNQWFDPQNQKLSEVNAANARKQNNAHTAGRKSYARLKREMEVVDGKEPDRLTFYEVTHKKRNGSFIDEECRRKIEKGHMLLAEKETNSDTNSKEISEQVFLEVHGPEHNGRVRCLGLGPTPSRYFGFQSINIPVTNGGCNESSEVDKLKEEIRAMAAELHAMRSFMSQKFPGENWMTTTSPASFEVEQESPNNQSP